MSAAAPSAASSAAGTLIQDRYVVDSSSIRLIDGSVEVDGTDTTQNGQKVTITFYPDKNAFAAVQQRYNTFTYRVIMRHHYARVDTSGGTAGSLRATASSAAGTAKSGGAGASFPPYLVTSRYQTLADWALTEGAHATSVVMAQQLEWFVRSVAQLHELGDVHGALQPHSVVNSVEQRGPAFRDLNSASRIGAQCKIRPDLKYMPPEVAHAADCGTDSLPSSTAADIWAIGVIAYEMFTRQPAFPQAFACAFAPADTGSGAGDNGHSGMGVLPPHVEQDVRERLLGRMPLQWEPGSPGVEARLACMGRFRDSVLLCLSRGPKQRPSAEGLLKLWREVYLSRYTIR